ncbi:outer membrane protein chaperone [beta proteobacterium AAP99]|nr:outer membrane protein chaperone [beta proteobacterium AAP99]
MDMLKKVLVTLALCVAAAAGTAAAQDVRIGYVNFDRILRDSAPAQAAGQKLEAEFSKRKRDLEELGARLKAQFDKLEKDSAVLSEADRNRRQRELSEQERDFQRRRREYEEDLNQRRNEELAAVLERANRAMRQIAEQEKYDLIVQDAVFNSPRIDITEKVLRALSNAR